LSRVGLEVKDFFESIGNVPDRVPQPNFVFPLLEFEEHIPPYQQRHNLDDVALTAVLGCSLDVLTDLRLCRRTSFIASTHLPARSPC
jgi:hypothetical protein